MFFTRIGIVIAWIGFAMGALRAGTGFMVASSFDGSEAAARRYLGSATSGEAIDQGTLAIVCAVALGILVEISRSVQKQTKAQ